MKSIILTLLISWTSILASAQVDEIKMITDYSSDDQVLRDLLYFEKIDYFKVNFTNPKLKGKNYKLISKNIWNGEVTKVDTLVDTSADKRLKGLESDTLSMRVIAKKIAQQELKFQFIFPKFWFAKFYKTVDTNEYSLRAIGTKFNIELNKPFYALACILPYEKDGYKYFCAVDSSGKAVEQWGKQFGIEHYIVFEMQFD